MIKLFLIEQLFCFMMFKKKKGDKNEDYRITRFKIN